MKIFYYPIMALSAAGTLLSAILLYQHFSPDAGQGILSCGSGVVNPCMVLSYSGFSEFLSIPVAAYGLLFYIFMLFIVLVADYAMEQYLILAAGFSAFLSFISVLIDIALGSILISSGIFCNFCIATYAINVLMMIFSILWLKKSLAERGWSIPKFIRSLPGLFPDSPAQRAASSFFILFIFLLGFSVLFTMGHTMKLKSDKPKISDKDIISFIDEFYKTKEEKFDLPESKMTIGNPNAEYKIYVFSDFLCGHCYNLYKTEKLLLPRYHDKIKIVYFHYPLEAECNSEMKQTMYENSCAAAKAITAASKQGLFEQYLDLHFASHKSHKAGYKANEAFDKLKAMKHKEKSTDANEMISDMESAETAELIKSHVELAKKLNIKGVPTMFLEGRRLEGARQYEFLNALLKSELARIEAMKKKLGP